jgi:hypothetical protein
MPDRADRGRAGRVLAGASAATLLAILSAPSAGAAPGAASSRPHGGAWHFVNNNGTVKTARMTVGRSGVRASRITVRPAKGFCSRNGAATISGTFRITHTTGSYRWKIGGTQAAAQPVQVTIHQGGKRTTGELFVGFRSRTRAVGELVLGTTQSCDLHFGLRR